MKDFLLAHGVEIAVGILAIVFGTKWWQSKRGWLTRIIEKTADVAVAEVERSYVAPYKVEAKLLKLPSGAQELARTKAKTAIKGRLAVIGVDVLESMWPVVGTAIEAAVQRMKQKLPAASVAKFPLWLLWLPLVGFLAGGCLSLPAGWSESNADQLEAVAQAAAPLWVSPQTDPELGCLRNAGNLGAAVYTESGRLDADGTHKEVRLRAAIRAMDEYATTIYPNILAGRNLAALIRVRLGVAANDADQLLGVLLAAIRAAP